MGGCVFCDKPIGSAGHTDAFTKAARKIFMCNSCYGELTNECPPGMENTYGFYRGKCEVCGSSVWDKDIRSGSCPICGTLLGGDKNGSH